jgi:hypothetical protein
MPMRGCGSKCRWRHESMAANSPPPRPGSRWIRAEPSTRPDVPRDFRGPELGGPPAAVGTRAALQPAGVFERAEGAVDLAGFLVATEEVTDFGAADPVGPVCGERPDVIGSGIAEAVPKIQALQARA